MAKEIFCSKCQGNVNPSSPCSVHPLPDDCPLRKSLQDHEEDMVVQRRAEEIHKEKMAKLAGKDMAEALAQAKKEQAAAQ